MIPGEVTATGSQLCSCLAEWQCGGLANRRAERWACQLGQRSTSVHTHGVLLVRKDPGSIPVPSSCLVPAVTVLVLPAGTTPRCFTGRHRAGRRHWSSFQHSNPSCLEEEEDAESSASRNLQTDLLKACTNLCFTLRTTCNHGFPGASPCPDMVLWLDLVQPCPFAWEHHPNCGQISSGEEVGPDHVRNEQGSAMGSSPVAATASEFELKVMYVRAGGRQRRDCMCLFLPSARSALLPCPALLMAFAPARPSPHLLARHSPH